ncbi:MAG TPA: ATPase, T2SS/T4P/T4SS family, partial [Candidatus Paceibacterota bacterium]
VSALRSFLRQDPNIIMVGEIRDIETADISIQAALTGHMVLSSLHTNDAPTAIPRLFDMNIPPFLVSAVLNTVVAQRLVRRICKDCIYSYKPPSHLVDAIRLEASELGIVKINIPKLIYAGKGCNICGDTGYKGRIGIFEILKISEGVRGLINSSNFSLDNLRKLVRQDGMVSMFEDGMAKAEVGETTIEELLRVVRE